jgi:ATP-dependent metalloprotease FtsH
LNKFLQWIKKNIAGLIIVVLFFGVPMLQNAQKNPPTEAKTAQYTEFMQMVKDKKIDKVSIDLNSSTFKFSDTDGTQYTTDNPKDKEFKKTLLENGIKVSEYESSNMLDIISRLLNFAFLIIMGFSILSFVKGMGGSKKTAEPVANVPNITFDKIAGNKEVKDDVKVVVDFLKSPGKYTASGAKMTKGMILYGPPGTGKTLTAKAIAGEAGVPFFSVSGSDFVEMYVGVGAKRVRELFTQARKKAPCIIFIDEFDAIGGKRGINSHSENDQTINALLTEMDGFQGNEGILLIAATNRLDSLDEALIRAGRFDKHVMIPLPQSPAERLDILKLHTANKKLADDVSLENLARQTYNFSGSDLEALLNEATIISVSEGKDTVDKACIDKAIYQKLLKGHQKHDLERQDEEVRLVAWHEAGHALVAKLLTDWDIPNVTIIASTSGAGGVTFTAPKKMGLMSKRDLYNDIKVSYAGNVAEYLLLKDEDSVTTGAYNDYQQATNKIKHIITSYGMNKTVGRLNLNVLEVNVSSDLVLKEATMLSDTLYEETVVLLTENKATLEKIANALIERETLSEDELDEIIKGTSELNMNKVIDTDKKTEA